MGSIRAAAKINGVTYCSTILPWRGVQANSAPWQGSNHSEMTENAIKTLLSKLPTNDLVWGGEWNHSLIGKEHAGSMGGRNHLLDAISKLELNVPTSGLSHRGNYCQAIDHIGVPLSWTVESVKRIDAEGLSDHQIMTCMLSKRKELRQHLRSVRSAQLVSHWLDVKSANLHVVGLGH